MNVEQNPEKYYRRELAKKHLAAARILAVRGFPPEVVKREIDIVRLVWGQYRQIPIKQTENA